MDPASWCTPLQYLPNRPSRGLPPAARPRSGRAASVRPHIHGLITAPCLCLWSLHAHVAWHARSALHGGKTSARHFLGRRFFCALRVGVGRRFRYRCERYEQMILRVFCSGVGVSGLSPGRATGSRQSTWVCLEKRKNMRAKNRSSSQTLSAVNLGSVRKRKTRAAFSVGRNLHPFAPAEPWTPSLLEAQCRLA